MTENEQPGHTEDIERLIKEELMEELFGDQDKIFKGETDGEQEEEDEMTEEEMTEEEEDTDSDEDERGCCDRHYTSALETPLGRGEKAEYERRLVAAGVPNRVTLSQVVEQDFLDFATALGQLADEQADECRKVRKHSRTFLFPCVCKCDNTRQSCQLMRESLRELFEAEQEGKALRLEFIQEVNRI